MRTDILSFRVAEPECYICGSKEIEMLCHKCKRPMCYAHGPEPIPVGNFLQRVVDVEFIDLNLLDFLKNESAIHCRDCNNHYVSSFRLTRIFFPLFIILLLIGIWTTSLTWAVVTIISSAMFLTMGLFRLWTRNKRLLLDFQKLKPPFPIVGQFISIDVREALENKITLNAEGEYEAFALGRAKGKIEFTSFLSESDSERLVRYQTKHQLPPNEVVEYHAGFVVLRGESKFYENKSYSTLLNPIELTGRLSREDFFVNMVSWQRSPWNKKVYYSFDLRREDNVGLPIQIVPTLISENNDWSIQFLLQSNPSIFLSPLSDPKILSFKLMLLGDMSGVENRNPYGRIEKIFNGQEQQGWQVSWENLDLKKISGQESYGKYFSVRLKDSKNILPQKIVLKGEVDVHFDGALSGFNNVDFYSPLGSKFRVKENISVTKKCKILVSFDFDLKGLNLHKIITKTQWRKKNGAIPEPEAITRLVKILSEKKYYIQRVIENMPGTSQADARVVKRLWVISGHNYEYDQPINFRIIAKGVEIYDSSDEPYDGRTEYKIVVRGVVSEKGQEINLGLVQTEIVDIIAQEPNLEVRWFDKEYCLRKWEKIEFALESNGDIPADEIIVSLSGPSLKFDDQEVPKRNLPEKGGKLNYSLSVFFEARGDVPVILQVVCKDKFGKFAPRKWKKIVKVEDEPATEGHRFIKNIKSGASKLQ